MLDSAGLLQATGQTRATHLQGVISKGGCQHGVEPGFKFSQQILPGFTQIPVLDIAKSFAFRGLSGKSHLKLTNPRLHLEVF